MNTERSLEILFKYTLPESFLTERCLTEILHDLVACSSLTTSCRVNVVNVTRSLPVLILDCSNSIFNNFHDFHVLLPQYLYSLIATFWVSRGQKPRHHETASQLTDPYIHLQMAQCLIENSPFCYRNYSHISVVFFQTKEQVGITFQNCASETFFPPSHSGLRKQILPTGCSWGQKHQPCFPSCFSFPLAITQVALRC